MRRLEKRIYVPLPDRAARREQFRIGFRSLQGQLSFRGGLGLGLAEAEATQQQQQQQDEGKKGVEIESEEMGGLTSLLVGIVCQKPYEEPEPDEHLSTALFLLGSAINDADTDDDQNDLVSAPYKMEIEVDLEEEGRVIDVSDDDDIISNDSNKCQFIPLSIIDPPKTPKRPNTSSKFGRGKRRGGNRK